MNNGCLAWPLHVLIYGKVLVGSAALRLESSTAQQMQTGRPICMRGSSCTKVIVNLLWMQTNSTPYGLFEFERKSTFPPIVQSRKTIHKYCSSLDVLRFLYGLYSCQIYMEFWSSIMHVDLRTGTDRLPKRYNILLHKHGNLVALTTSIKLLMHGVRKMHDPLATHLQWRHKQRATRQM